MRGTVTCLRPHYASFCAVAYVLGVCLRVSITQRHRGALQMIVVPGVMLPPTQLVRGHSSYQGTNHHTTLPACPISLLAHPQLHLACPTPIPSGSLCFTPSLSTCPPAVVEARLPACMSPAPPHPAPPHPQPRCRCSCCCRHTCRGGRYAAATHNGKGVGGRWP